MTSLAKTSDATSVCTRLFPYGEGEGVNQLGISDLTPGNKPYIESPQTYIDKYGLIQRAWIDRRYSNAESLHEAAKTMLEELQEPYEEYIVDFAMLGNDYYDTPEIGKTVEIVDFKKTYITEIAYDYDEIEKTVIALANKPKDTAATVADIMDRQRIEMSYAQGATQFYQDHVYDNADANTSLQLKLMLPSDMKIINKVLIDVEVGPFRKPFTVTGGGGAQTVSQINTTSSGASTLSTTYSGGGQTSGSSSLNTTYQSQSTYTSSDYVQTSQERVYAYTGLMSSFGADHNHLLDAGYHSHTTQHFHLVYPHTHDMAHTHYINDHNHYMDHYHSIAHSHAIPDHIHNLTPGISYGGNPSSFNLIINGQIVQTVVGRNFQIDITRYLLGSNREIPRDTYHKIEISPNDAAYVMLTVGVQGFIQSRGDMAV